MNVLGRYGDALNPWGDILTVARAWCVSSPQAKVLSTYQYRSVYIHLYILTVARAWCISSPQAKVISTYEYLSVYLSIYSNSGKSMVCILSTS